MVAFLSIRRLRRPRRHFLVADSHSLLPSLHDPVPSLPRRHAPLVLAEHPPQVQPPPQLAVEVRRRERLANESLVVLRNVLIVGVYARHATPRSPATASLSPAVPGPYSRSVPRVHSHGERDPITSMPKSPHTPEQCLSLDRCPPRPLVGLPQEHRRPIRGQYPWRPDPEHAHSHGPRTLRGRSFSALRSVRSLQEIGEVGEIAVGAANDDELIARVWVLHRYRRARSTSRHHDRVDGLVTGWALIEAASEPRGSFILGVQFLIVFGGVVRSMHHWRQERCGDRPWGGLLLVPIFQFRSDRS